MVVRIVIMSLRSLAVLPPNVLRSIVRNMVGA